MDASLTQVGESGFSALAEQVLNCRLCPSMPPERRRVPGHGAVAPALAFVGEAPGRFGGDRTGVPFSGDRSGQFLRELIAELGLNVERDIYITNAVKCNPRDERGNNRVPRPDEVAACRPYLERELQLLRPRLVVPLGGLACRVLLARPLREVRGMLIRQHGLSFYPLYHPSYSVSYGYSRTRYREEFMALRTLVANRDAPSHGAQQQCEGRERQDDPTGADERGAAVLFEPGLEG